MRADQMKTTERERAGERDRERQREGEGSEGEAESNKSSVIRTMKLSFRFPALIEKRLEQKYFSLNSFLASAES